MSKLENVLPTINVTLMKKLRRVFDHFDQNQNGVWDKNDMQIIFDKVKFRTSHLDEKRQKEVKDIISMFMKSIVGETDTTVVTWDEFLKCFDDHIGPNLKEFQSKIIIFRNAVFECMDENKDGLISFEEFKAFRYYEKCTEVSELKRVFDILDRNKDGYIDKDEYISAFLTYFTDRTVGHDYLPLFE